MKNIFSGLIIFILCANTLVHAGIVSGLRKGIEALSVANDAIRTEKAGASAANKIKNIENSSKMINETKNIMSPELTTMITARSAQILNKCTLNTKSKDKEIICKNKSENFQQCVADQIIQNISEKSSIINCEKLYK